MGGLQGGEGRQGLELEGKKKGAKDSKRRGSYNEGREGIEGGGRCLGSIGEMRYWNWGVGLRLCSWRVDHWWVFLTRFARKWWAAPVLLPVLCVDLMWMVRNEGALWFRIGATERWVRGRVTPPDVCVSCRYDLRGLPDGAPCPEWGRGLSRAA